MSKFDATTAIDPMEVDFSKYGGPVGTIPEPSGPQVELFMERIREYRKKRADLAKEGDRIKETGDEEAMEAWLESVPEDELREEAKQMHIWVQELTSDYLQADMLEKLNPRLWTKFFKWLVGEMSPKADD